MFLVPEATFTQQFVMWSFFIGTPVMLILFVVFLGYKSIRQNKDSKKCLNCLEFIASKSDYCPKCQKD
jgi:ABC-type arginine/histidine transport system permease subunit